jgi:hypothetical protein
MNSFSRSATRQKSTSLLQKPLAELTEQEENALAEALEVHLMHSLAAANPRSSLVSVSSLGGESTRVLGASDGRLADGAATAGANSPGTNSHQNQNHVSQFDSPRSHHANSNSRSSVSFSRRDRLAIMQHASRAHREDDGDDVPSVSNFLRSLDHECNNEPTLASEDRLAAETSAAASSATLRERRSSSRLQSARTAACCVLQRGCCCSRKCFGRTLCRTVISKLSRLSAFVLFVLLHITGSALVAASVLLMLYRESLSKAGGWGRMAANGTLATVPTIELVDTAGAAISTAILAFLLIVIGVVARTITRWRAYQLWSFYVLTAVGFGCIYRFLNTVDYNVAQLPNGWSTDNVTLQVMYDPNVGMGPGYSSHKEIPGEGRLILLFMYFSMTTQTSVGYGDIVPASIIMRILASFQMFLGLAYGSMLVGLTMESDMQLLLNSRHAKLTKQLKRLVDWKEQEAARGRFMRRRYEYEVALRRERAGRCCRQVHHACLTLCVGFCCNYDEKCTCYFVKKIVKNTIVVRVRRLLRNWLLTFTGVVVFAFNFFVNDASTETVRLGNEHIPVLIFVLGLCIHAVLLVVIVGTSMKFVRKTEQVTVQFLCKAFLATCALFGSMYTLLSLWDPSSFNNTQALVYHTLHREKNQGMYWVDELFRRFGRQFTTFMYYSITTMSTTGFGFVTPHSMWAQCLVMCQELMSVLFAQIVLGVGIQSVAVKMEMKKDPGKFALLDTSTMEENIRGLLQGHEPSLSGDLSGLDDTMVGDGEEGKDAVLGLPKVEDKAVSLQVYKTYANHENTSGRERSSSLVVSDLMHHISQLEHAMKRS